MAKGRATANLAGLAALGALGYMLSKDKKGEGAPVETRALSRASAAAMPAAMPAAMSPAAPAAAAVDYGDDRDIGGGFNPAGLRRNMETGEMYDPGTVPSRTSARAAPVARAAAPRAAAPAASAASRPAPAASRPASAASRPASAASSPASVARSAGDMAAERDIRERTLALMRQAGESAGLGGRPDLSTPEGRRRAEQEQAVENVYPEQYLIGGPGVKGVAALAKGLANRGTARTAGSTAPYLKELPAPTPRLTGPSSTELREAARASRAGSRQEEMLRDNAARYGLDPTAPGYAAAMQALRDKIGGNAFTVKKKGGAVKAKAKAATKKMASGGSTSSASKRGDGIASRGRTKCKMY